MRRRTESAPVSLFAFQDIITAVTGIILLITITLAILLITSSKARPDDDRTRYHQDLKNEIESLTAQRSKLDAKLHDLSNENAKISRLSSEELQREVETAERRLTEQASRVSDLESQAAELEAAWNQQKTEISSLNVELATEMVKDKGEIERVKDELSKLQSSKQLLFNLSEKSSKRAWVVQISGNGVKLAPADANTPPQSYRSESQFIADLESYPQSKNFFVLFVQPSGITAFQEIKFSLELEAYDFGIDVISEADSIIP